MPTRRERSPELPRKVPVEIPSPSQKIIRKKRKQEREAIAVGEAAAPEATSVKRAVGRVPSQLIEFLNTKVLKEIAVVPPPVHRPQRRHQSLPNSTQWHAEQLLHHPLERPPVQTRGETGRTEIESRHGGRPASLTTHLRTTRATEAGPPIVRIPSRKADDKDRFDTVPHMRSQPLRKGRPREKRTSTIGCGTSTTEHIVGGHGAEGHHKACRRSESSHVETEKQRGGIEEACSERGCRGCGGGGWPGQTRKNRAKWEGCPNEVDGRSGADIGVDWQAEQGGSRRQLLGGSVQDRRCDERPELQRRRPEVEGLCGRDTNREPNAAKWRYTCVAGRAKARCGTTA